MPETASPQDRATIPLLTLITQQSMDEDYEHVAERRAAETGEPVRRRPHRMAAIVVGVFGLLVTIAAVQTSQRSGVEDASRAALVSQIEDRRESVADSQRQVVRLRELNLALQERLGDVTASAQAAIARTDRLAAATGFEAVTGPGVRVTVDDAPNGTAVRDRDLRPLVDGLWAAGAEAIAINGQRLTARSAIRNSGAAIHVNVRPLSPPYVILAIGDTGSLQADLMETTGGLRFRGTAESLGFPWGMDNEDQLSLPAAPQRLLRLRSAAEGTAAENLNQHQKETPK